MSRAELPHTITSHPHLALTLSTPSDPDTLHAAGTPSPTTPPPPPPVFIAGEPIVGSLHLECRAAHVLSLGRIEVEVVGREDARTRDDLVQSIVWQASAPFQGPGLPVSNACDPSSSNGSPLRGYFLSRKGTTTFPIHLPTPATLPPSLRTPSANITYTLYASVFILEHPGGTRAVLHASREITLVSPTGIVAVVAAAAAAGEVGYGEVKVPQDVGAGVGATPWAGESLKVEVRGGMGWGVEGGRGRVGVAVSNRTGAMTGLPRLELLRRLMVKLPGKEDAVIEQAVVERSYPGEYRVTRPWSESVMYLDYPLPLGVCTVPPSALSSLRMEVSLRVHIPLEFPEKPALVATTTIPFPIFHPASLPAEMWLASETFQAEHAALSLSPVPTPTAPTAQRRWTAPLKAVAGLLSPLVRSPVDPPGGHTAYPAYNAEPGQVVHVQPGQVMQVSPPQRRAITGLPAQQSTHPFSPYRQPGHRLPTPPSSHPHPVGPYSYASAYPQPHAPCPPLPAPYAQATQYTQPEWGLYALPEDDETRAERTSRHLRETSRGRGRSVTPPPVGGRGTPMGSVLVSGYPQGYAAGSGSGPGVVRPGSVAGPRPPPGRRTSTSASAAPQYTPQNPDPSLSPTIPISPLRVPLPMVPLTVDTAPNHFLPPTPELLSPRPMVFSPPAGKEYFDEPASPSPEVSSTGDATASTDSPAKAKSSADPTGRSTGRLSRDTVKSLEAMALALDSATQFPPLDDAILAKMGIQPESGKAVNYDKTLPPRPEGTSTRRRRNSESRVMSVMEIFRQAEAKREEKMAGGRGVGRKGVAGFAGDGGMHAGGQPVPAEPVRSAPKRIEKTFPPPQTPTSPTSPVDPNKSARGGRGGRVTFARELFTTLIDQSQPPVPALAPAPAARQRPPNAKRISLPPNIASPRKAPAPVLTTSPTNAGVVESAASIRRPVGSGASGESGAGGAGRREDPGQRVFERKLAEARIRGASGGAEGSGGKKAERGAVGKLKGLIERYERGV
ncbi:hypothetical protein IAT38_007683 [Cryptococcus sp. DSM 104549]